MGRDDWGTARMQCGSFHGHGMMETFPADVEITGAPLGPPLSFLSRKQFKQDLYTHLRQTRLGPSPLLSLH